MAYIIYLLVGSAFILFAHKTGHIIYCHIILISF